MTLKEAIEHCHQKACNNSACAEEHAQLERWLLELASLKNFLESSDLDEALKKYLRRSPGSPRIKKDAFKYGALWQMEEIARNNLLLPFKEYDRLKESIERQKTKGYQDGYKQGQKDGEEKCLKVRNISHFTY